MVITIETSLYFSKNKRISPIVPIIMNLDNCVDVDDNESCDKFWGVEM